MNEDTERLDWLSTAAAELKIIIQLSSTGYYEVYLGQICIPGRTLRDALDTAIEATRERTL